jgi:hypothetical protein
MEDLKQGRQVKGTYNEACAASAASHARAHPIVAANEG